MSRSTRNKKAEPIRDKKRLVGFGKYSKETIQEVIDNDPQYLLWLHENTDFELHADLLEEIEDMAKPDHAFKGWTSRYDARN